MIKHMLGPHMTWHFQLLVVSLWLKRTQELKIKVKKKKKSKEKNSSTAFKMVKSENILQILSISWVVIDGLSPHRWCHNAISKIFHKSIWTASLLRILPSYPLHYLALKAASLWSNTPTSTLSSNLVLRRCHPPLPGATIAYFAVARIHAFSKSDQGYPIVAIISHQIEPYWHGVELKH